MVVSPELNLLHIKINGYGVDRQMTNIFGLVNFVTYKLDGNLSLFGSLFVLKVECIHIHQGKELHDSI